MKTLLFGLPGWTFELQTNSQELLDFWRFYTRGFSATGEPMLSYRALAGERTTFERVGGQLQELQSPAELMPALEGAFLADLVDFVGSGCAIYHGAAFACGGEARVYLGESGAGKSTLCLERVAAGDTYLTDELVAIDGDEVIALPRPICFNHREGETFAHIPHATHFDQLSLDFLAEDGERRQAEYLLPTEERYARAGERFTLGELFWLERGVNGPPQHTLLTGSELRARLAISRFPVTPIGR